MSNFRKRLAVAFAGALLAGAAHAEVFHVCSVRETKDGFVALRAAPGKHAPILARMRPGEMTVLDVKNYELVRSGGWVSLSWFPGEIMPARGEDGYEKVRRGWASYELIDDCG